MIDIVSVTLDSSLLWIVNTTRRPWLCHYDDYDDVDDDDGVGDDDDDDGDDSDGDD